MAKEFNEEVPVGIFGEPFRDSPAAQEDASAWQALHEPVKTPTLKQQPHPLLVSLTEEQKNLISPERMLRRQQLPQEKDHH